MPFNFSEVLLDPIYNSDLGVDATLTLPDGSTSFAITVIDKTNGVNVGTNVDVPTIVPCAAIRYAELTSNGINKTDIVGGTLEFNGMTWNITNIRPDPNPSGERSGEVYAMLDNPNELAPSSE